MRVAVALSNRFWLTESGDAATAIAAFGETFWNRYLRVFDEVVVIGQPHGSGCDGNATLIARPQLSFHLVSLRSSIRRPTTFLAELRCLREKLMQVDAVLLRFPSLEGLLIATFVLRGRVPFGIELVADPAEALRHAFPGVRGRVLGKVIGFWTKRIVSRALAVGYVTRHILQDRYPPGIAAATSDYSSVALRAGDIAHRPKSMFTQPTRLVCVAHLERPYKGVHILLGAFALLRRTHPVTLTIVGGGRLQEALESKSSELALGDLVRFTGRVSQDDVRGYLDESDMLVQASLTEGLPRAVIEAMARGLPVVASDVGGTSELIDRTALFRAGDIEALASILRSRVDDGEWLRAQAAKNLVRAQRFEESAQAGRQDYIYSVIADAGRRQG